MQCSNARLLCSDGSGHLNELNPIAQLACEQAYLRITHASGAKRSGGKESGEEVPRFRSRDFARACASVLACAPT